MPDGYRLLWAGWYRLEDGAGPYAWDGAAGFALIGSGRGEAGGAVGGAALLEGEANGFATDFTYATDASRVAVKAASVTTSYGLDSFYGNGGTSPKLVYDVAGNLVWSPHNICLRSEDFTATWTLTGTPVLTAHTIQDDDAAATEFITSGALTTVVGETYTATAWILKDAVISRFPAMMTIAGASHRTININTSTGETATVTSTLAGSSTVVDTGTHWQLSITFVSTAAAFNIRLYPAYGTTLGVSNNAAVGTVTIDKVQFCRGSVPTAYLPTTTTVRNGLAIDYDPVTHASKGLLCEPAGTNLLLNNTTLSTQSVTVSAVAYTLSFFGTGTVTLSGVSTAGPLVGTGASNRVSLTFTPTAGSLTCTVTGTVSRAQLEAGLVATSPIPTFAASATRAADGGAITALLSTIGYSATEGTLYVDWEPIANAVGPVNYAIGMDDGTNSERILAYMGTATTSVFVVTDGGVAQATINGVMAANTRTQQSVAWKLNDFATSTNGAAVGVDISGTLPTMTTLRVAGTASGTGGVNRIRRIVYVPRRVVDASLPAWRYTA